MVNEIKGHHQAVVANINNTGQTGRTAPRPQSNIDNGDANRTGKAPDSNVTLTDAAARLRALEQQVASQPVVDSKRVEAIRQTITDGTYHVNAGRTAEKMAAFESLLDSKLGGG